MKIPMVAAAIMGAAGVALLAAGSHAAPGSATIAGQMLLFHAPVVMVAALAGSFARLHSQAGTVAIAMMIVGVALFSADLALRGLGYGRLFAMAAPIGGSATILSWIVLAIAAAFAPPDRQE